MVNHMLPFISQLRCFLVSVLSFSLVACGSMDGLLPGGEEDVSQEEISNETNTKGAVAMPDIYSADVAELILHEGGNAVDAAVAVGFVLAVTYPEAGNIGGGGFMTIHMGGQSYFLDYRETAPSGATRDMYLDDKGDVIPRLSLIGGKAIGVPGTVWGMWEAHQRFGRLPWADLIQPAIKLAREGFDVDEELALNAARNVKTFSGKTNFADYFAWLDDGGRFKQLELAKTLERIAKQGPEGFYQGKVADQIVAQMQKSDGLITLADLASYRPKWRVPLTFDWDDYTVVSAPPPSSGGIALAQLLKMKSQLAPAFEGVEHNSSQYIHLLAEIEKRVFADRAKYLGDPDFNTIPITALIDDAYLAKRAAQVKTDAISTVAEVPPGLESPDTTHYSITDRFGNAVSNTYTLNWSFGSGVVVEGAGFLLNNEMDDFSAKPGVPNGFGVTGGAVNAIEPGKRMLSSMAPTILLRGGEPVVVIGTPGGSTIFTTIFQVLLNDLEYGMSTKDAVAAPRFHHQLPRVKSLRFDKTIIVSEDVRARLREKGYDTVVNPWGDMGDVHAINLLGNDPEAASDPRGRGHARIVDTNKRSWLPF